MKKFDLAKFKKAYVVEMKPTYHGWLFFGSLVLSVFLIDLEMTYHLPMPILFGLSVFLLWFSAMYIVCWSVCCFIYAILKKRELKRLNDIKKNK